MALREKPQEANRYTIDSNDLRQALSQRYLGLLVQQDLSWTEQHSLVCKRSYISLNLIKRTIPANSSTNLKKQLYLSLVRSHLSYCSQLWRPRHIKNIQNIERVQRRATKYILNDATSNYKSRLLQLKLLPVMNWLELQDIMFLVKSLKQSQNSIGAEFVSFTVSNTRAGQSGRKLYMTRAKTNYTRHFFFVRIARLWNSFPADILDLSTSLNTIKQKVQKHLIANFERNFDPSNVCSYHLICPCRNCYILQWNY